MPLAVPLAQLQIEAANRLHTRLRQWSAADRALGALAERFPGFDEASTLLKAVTINAMYGTNVWALDRMARHIMTVTSETDLARAGPELVERLAHPPRVPDETYRRRYSFASKFAHFFVEAERYPILDSYAAKMVEFHLGKKNLVKRPGHSYIAFVENLGLLRAGAGLQISTRELDHYLWIAGEYRAWRRDPEKAQINVELRGLFADPSPADRAELAILWPEPPQ